MDAIDRALRSTKLNPCVVLPTGSGKSPIMAWLIQRYAEQAPGLRVCIVAHVKELIQQNHAKLQAIAPGLQPGIWCAGLGRKDRSAIVYASIQSIYKRAAGLDPFDLILVDECHSIPMEGEGMYRRFIDEARLQNPKLRVIGFTATPYRLDGGGIIHPENVLQMKAYDANVKELIASGYLCPITSKHGKNTPDVSGLHIDRGDFRQSEVDDLLEDEEKVNLAVDESLRLAEGRNRILLFCSSVLHAWMVNQELTARGVAADTVHHKLLPAKRATLLKDFEAGRLRALCNVNILSEGYDNPAIDCIVMLRPTASAGLFVQQVGRGLRKHPDKADCLVIDMAGNIERFGPIDQIVIDAKRNRGKGEPIMKGCPECGEYSFIHSKECGECGHLFPERPEARHATTASGEAIISTEDEPRTLQVKSVSARKHISKKTGGESIKVTYHCGLSRPAEYVCFGREGWPGVKAARWWVERFDTPCPASVDDAAQLIFLSQWLTELTESVTVKRNGKYSEITNVTLRDGKAANPAAPLSSGDTPRLDSTERRATYIRKRGLHNDGYLWMPSLDPSKSRRGR